MDIKITYNDQTIFGNLGESLSAALLRGGIPHPHPCSGRGTCGKCRVIVDGVSTLACQYILTHDITVTAQGEGEILSQNVAPDSTATACGTDAVLDLGSTTLAMALIDRPSGSVTQVTSATNPQRAYGADVISRIEYCKSNGVDELARVIRDKVNEMISELGQGELDALYVAGNTTMLHIFAGADPCDMGTAPYTPKFIEGLTVSAEQYGIKGVKTVCLLPSVSAFLGADVVAGIYSVGLPTDKYRLLIDLGTNAEIALISQDRIITTSAAAGPCFEGACISSGMSATDGAIYSFDGIEAKTVNGAPARGICGTGLVDIVAFLLRRAKLDTNGNLDEEEFEIAPGVSLTQEDIRQYQLAKSAIFSAIVTLTEKCGVKLDDIETVYISGGFSSEMNSQNAALTGLIPCELRDKCRPAGNTSLKGAIKYVIEGGNLGDIVCKTSYIDLSRDTGFADLFIKNMQFSH